MTTLAEAIYRAQRDDRTMLRCTGLCLRRKPRTDFRETPWHGRAAACWDCEAWGSRQLLLAYERQRWELEQAREKLRMYARYASYLKLRRLLEQAPSSADVLRSVEDPYVRAIAKYTDGIARTIAFAVKTMEEST
ncbi:hypothetical protein [Streptomyces sp. NPDC056291]|uniref:hypothetical protein n=1 Tax=Streptomyces sp. NPDC056291 TaxID=3345772 RepID=UPI0035DB4764